MKDGLLFWDLKLLAGYLSQMKIFSQALVFFNLLSLDVVLGSVAGMYFFSGILQSNCPSVSYWVLALAVWGIYTLDHLLDAKMARQKAISKRHQFHQQNFRLVSAIWILVVLTGLTLLFSSSEIQFLIIPGFVLAILMTFWMGLLKWIGEKASWLKEISTAIFYVTGISLAPWLLRDPESHFTIFVLLILGYLILALSNLLILSYIDHKADKGDGFGSILVLISRDQLSKVIWFIGIFGLAYLAAILVYQPSYYRMHISLIILMLMFHLIQFGRETSDGDLARQKMEAIFIMPLVLLLI